MLNFLLRRLGFGLIVLLLVTFFAFILVYLTGDPAVTLAGMDASPADVERIRAAYGLDQPLFVQYLQFLGNALQGDLGTSFRTKAPVGPLVLERLFITLQLVLVSMVISLGVGIPLGVLAATSRSRVLKSLVTGFSVLTVSTPAFWVGLILILVFADQLRLLPASGRGGPESFILPAITLSLYTVGLIIRLVRRSLSDELGSQYVLTGAAKGLARPRIVLRHALRNALIPTVTVVGLQLGYVVGGSIVVESIFAWPGIGSLMINSINTTDMPVVRAIVLVAGAAFVIINLLVDLSYAWLDPKVKIE